MKLPLQNQPSTTTLSARFVACALAATFAGFGSVHAQGDKTNTSTGLKAGSKVTTGKNNTADGFNALLKNKTGNFNTAIGSKALKKTTGSSNVAIGFEALFKNQAGQFNVAIGDGAMKFNVTGNNNVALGMDAGALTTGSDNILIDHKGVGGESGKIRIGTPGTHSDTFLSGVVHGNGSGLTGVTATSVSGSVNGGQITAGSITSAALAPGLSLSGNIGIGTTTAGAPLEVAGSSVGATNGVGMASFGPTSGQHIAIDNNEIMSYNGNNPSTLYLGFWGGTVAIASGSGGGNVGIGTSSPTSKLEVRGDIELGPNGQYQATASGEKLRIVRGMVTTSGTINSGSGFTVNKTGVGTYEITYSSAFADTPAIIVTVEEATAPQIATYTGIGSSSITVKIWTTGGAPVDSFFSFTAMGAR
ncbi:MAG: hypothetical protein V4640_01720 [Verrucomicrobiota bacterium]